MKREMNKRWALFFSGKGSNLNAVLECYHTNWSMPPLLFTNNPESPAIKLAAGFGLETHILENKINYEQVSSLLAEAKVDALFLLGFLKIIPVEFLKDWKGRVFNLHPSMLPKYPGLHSIKKAYSKSDVIGVTIHHVTEGVDEGEPLVQSVVFEPGDYDLMSLEEVKTMVHSVEHNLVCDFIPMGEKTIG